MKYVLAFLSGLFFIYHAYGMMEEEGRPVEHFCPITHLVMRDPVVAADGYTYERNVIIRHLQTRRTSPLTNKPIDPTLVENRALKAMIDGWRLDLAVLPSAFVGRTASSIVDLIRSEFSRNRVLLDPQYTAQGHDIVVVFGNPGSGKSALVNLMAGKELCGQGGDYVLRHPEDPEAMRIGVSGSLGTVYPKSIDVGDLRVFDLPGFNNTDGSVRNLVNTAFIRQFLRAASSVRFVIVAGQDQFTADRSVSLKHLMQELQNLFVLEEQDRNFFNEFVFVVTKVTEQASDPIEFLLQKVSAQDQEVLAQQLHTWHEAGRFLTMHHPLCDKKRAFLRVLQENLLNILHQTQPARIRGFNVGALYPSETLSDLARVFLCMMEEAFARYVQTPLHTLSDYDQVIDFCSAGDFWQNFEKNLCDSDQAFCLLKAIGANPYTQALRDFEASFPMQREAYLKAVVERRQARVTDIQTRTKARLNGVISFARAEEGRKEGSRSINSVYYRKLYDAVCGTDVISQLAVDSPEKQLVQHFCEDLIDEHIRIKIDHIVNPAMQALLRRDQTSPLSPAAASVSGASDSIPRLLGDGLVIPAIADGHEAAYRLFYRMRLVYQAPSQERVELPFAALGHALLGGVFDLSACGNAAKYLHIATGFRREKIPDNEKKAEVWICPRFLAGRDRDAGHIRKIMGDWPLQIPEGFFFTCGHWDLGMYDYATRWPLADIKNMSLEEVAASAVQCARRSLVLLMGEIPILERDKPTHQGSSLGPMEVTT